MQAPTFGLRKPDAEYLKGMFRSKIFPDYLNIGDLRVWLQLDTNFSLAGQPNQMFRLTGMWELGLPQRYAV